MFGGGDDRHFRERSHFGHANLELQTALARLEVRRNEAHAELARMLFDDEPIRQSLKACRKVNVKLQALLDEILVLAESCRDNTHFLSAGISQTLRKVVALGTGVQKVRARELMDELVRTVEIPAIGTQMSTKSKKQTE